MYTGSSDPLGLDLRVPAVAQKVDLLCGRGVFLLTVCRRKTRDKRVQQAQQLKSDFPVIPVFL